MAAAGGDGGGFDVVRRAVAIFPLVESDLQSVESLPEEDRDREGGSQEEVDPVGLASARGFANVPGDLLGEGSTYVRLDVATFF